MIVIQIFFFPMPVVLSLFCTLRAFPSYGHGTQRKKVMEEAINFYLLLTQIVYNVHIQKVQYGI